jgi:hypothetical protein
MIPVFRRLKIERGETPWKRRCATGRDGIALRDAQKRLDAREGE